MTAQTDVYELCSLDEYDTEQAKIRSSLSWLIAKAHPSGTPENLQSLFHTDADGVWYLRPAVIESLISCELYSAVCNTLFGTSERRFKDFDSVLNYLKECGIGVQYGDNSELTSELMRSNSSSDDEGAFDLYAHITLCDSLMQAYANDLVKLDFVLETVAKYAPTLADPQSLAAASFDEALVLWLNSVCSQCDVELEKQAQLDSTFHYDLPQLTNVNDDLADGRALSLSLFFYAPVGCVRLADLGLQQSLSLADSVHNLVVFTNTYEKVLRELTSGKRDGEKSVLPSKRLKAERDNTTDSKKSGSPEVSTDSAAPNPFASVLATLTPAQTELLRTFRCYLTVEDFLYAVRTVELNAIVFLLELFYVSESVLNGSTPAASIAPVMSSSLFVPALETVVEVDGELSEPEPDSESHVDLPPAIPVNKSADNSVVSIPAPVSSPPPASRDELKTRARSDEKEKEKSSGSDTIKSPQSIVETKKSPVVQSEDVPSTEMQPGSKSLLEEKDRPKAVEPPAAQNRSPNSATSTNESSAQQQSSNETPSRITFGMLKRKPTPLVNPNAASTPTSTPTRSAHGSSANANANTSTSTTASATATTNTIPASSTATATSPAIRSLKEQFLMNKLAKREQTAAETAAKANASPGNTSQATTTWASIKRRSQTDLDLAAAASATPSNSTKDIMTQSMGAIVNQPNSNLGQGGDSQQTRSICDESASPSMSDLSTLHQCFEQKKRVIETERARVLDDLARQRQVTSNQPFAQLLNFRRARANEPPTAANNSQMPFTLATPSQNFAPSLSSQRDRLRTASLANLSTAHLTQRSNTLQDEKLMFREQVDSKFPQYHIELGGFQQQPRPASNSNGRQSLNNTTGPSLPSGLNLGPVTTSNEAASAFQQRAMWQAPSRVGGDFEPKFAAFPLDSSVSASYSFRAANAGRSASMFFLNEVVNTGGPSSQFIAAAAAVANSAEVHLRRTPSGSQLAQPSNSTLLQYNNAATKPEAQSQKQLPPQQPSQQEGLQSGRSRGVQRRVAVRPHSQLVGDAAQTAIDQMLRADSASVAASVNESPFVAVQHKAPIGNRPASGSRTDVHSASSTARSDMPANMVFRSDLAMKQRSPSYSSYPAAVEAAPHNENEVQPNATGNPAVIDRSVDSASGRSGLNPGGFFVVGGEPSGLSVAELEERRRRLIETASRRTEEAAARQREESAARAQRTDENERRRQADRARRDAAAHSSIERRPSDSTPNASGRPVVKASPVSAPLSAEGGASQRRVDGVRSRALRDERAKSAFVSVVDVDVDDAPDDSRSVVSVQRSGSINSSQLQRASSVTRPVRAVAPGANGMTQYVLANSNINLNAAESDAQTKLYVKPKSKSNRTVIMNAVAFACLAGAVNDQQKRAVLDEIERANGSHFVILFRDAGSTQFKAVYVFDEERDCLNRITGVGPRQLLPSMAEKFYKFNSGTKSFAEVTSTRHISAVIDAITIFERYWQGLRKATGSTSMANLDNPAPGQFAAGGPQYVNAGPLSAANTERMVIPNASPSVAAVQPSASRPAVNAAATTSARRGMSPAAPAVLAGMRPIRK